MTTAASQYPLIGVSPISNYFAPDNIQRHPLGTSVDFIDPYWGGGTAAYLQVPVSTAILVGEVVYADPTSNAVDIPNTANLGMPVLFALNAVLSSTSIQYGWFLSAGSFVAKSGASVAAAAAIGITAAGTLGANSAGKEILNARVQAPATTTVVKANVSTQNGSQFIRAPNSDGWFVGMALSGTGIPASTTVGSISSDGRTIGMVQVGTATAQLATATGGVSVTGTYNDGTRFWNVLSFNSAFAQGAIT